MALTCSGGSFSREMRGNIIDWGAAVNWLLPHVAHECHTHTRTHTHTHMHAHTFLCTQNKTGNWKNQTVGDSNEESRLDLDSRDANGSCLASCRFVGFSIVFSFQGSALKSTFAIQSRDKGQGWKALMNRSWSQSARYSCLTAPASNSLQTNTQSPFTLKHGNPIAAMHTPLFLY